MSIPKGGATGMISTERVICEHAGKRLEGYARRPAGKGPHPAVLIIHGGLGLSHIVPRAVERLVQSGYLVVAADMVGPEAQRGDEKTRDKAFAAFSQDPALAADRAAAWVDATAKLPGCAPDRIAAIGYCFGGHCVLELARRGADVRAVVSFHGILTTSAPAAPGAVKAEVAIYCGDRDPYVPVEHISALQQELTAARASFHITTFSDAEHAFTDPDAAKLGPPGLRHHAIADEVSWAGTMALLDLQLRGSRLG